MLTRCIFVIISDARADMQMEREREREGEASKGIRRQHSHEPDFLSSTKKTRNIYIILLSYCRINGFFGIDG